jgi:hypothetical protein
MAAPDHPEISGVCGWMLLQAGVITPLEEPAFLDEEGPSAEIPPFITTTNARELYDLQPGETVSEAIARKRSKTA